MANAGQRVGRGGSAAIGLYVEKVQRTLHAGETVCGVARLHGVAHSLLFTCIDRRARVDWAETPCKLSFLSRSRDHTGGGPISSDTTQPVVSPPAQREIAGIVEIELRGAAVCALTVT